MVAFAYQLVPINPVMAQVPESLICEMTRLAVRHNALNLAEGLPDFPPSAPVQQALQTALDQVGVHQSSNPHGLLSLREAIATYLQTHYQVSVDPESSITITTGATEGLYLAMASILSPGDEAILLSPFYEPYWPTLVSLGAKPVVCPLSFPHYQIDPEQLARHITPKTRLVVVNSPNNPTGSVLSAESLNALAQLAQQYNLWILSDEVYDQLLFDHHQHIPMASLPGMSERTATLYSVSKTYSATGWRVGCVIAPARLTSAIRGLHDCTTAGAPSLLQAAAAECFKLPAGFYADLRRRFQKKRQALMSILTAMDGELAPMQGAYYGWTRLPAGQTDAAVAQQLIEQAGVSVVPGRCFFEPGSIEGQRYLRWCYGKSAETLSKAKIALKSRNHP